MASTESLIFDLLVRDRASDGISKIGGSASSAAGNVDKLTARLDDVGRKSVTARLALAGDKEAQASLDRIDARLIGLDRRTASPNVTVEGAARATAEISAIDLELDKLGKKGGSADVAAKAVGSGGLAGPAGMVALVGAGVALAPVIATTTVGLGGLAAAAYKTISPILAAGTATAAAQQALAGLDPAQRAAYTSLGALKTQFGAFAKSLEPEVLDIFNQGLKLASGLLHDVQPVAAATGKALGIVVGEIGADLRTSQWQQFFGFMAKTAGPDIQQLGGLFVNLLNVLPPLLEDLQPVAMEMIQVADGAARITAGIAGLPADIDSLRQATDKWTGSIGQHLPAGNENIFQVVSGWVDWMGRHVPGGNKSLLDLAGSAGKASSATAAAGAAAAAAAPQVGTLAGDVALLNSNTTLATDATKAFNDMWLQFVGKSVSDQQAVLAMSGAFDAYNASLKTNKADSTVAQQAFLSIITTMGSGLSTLQQNGASVDQVNRFYQVNIDKLNALHGLTPQQRADIQDITRDYDTWANSTAGLTRQTQTAAGALKNDFLAQIGSVAAHAPGVSGDVSNLADAILKTGTQSSATRGDRQKLIDDLVRAGLTADAARALVKNLQGQIDAMHGKTVTVDAAARGSGQITATENIFGMQTQKLGSLTFVASGGKITGGTPGRDSVLGMLMPGEVVVPAQMVAAGAVDHLKGRLPGFAAGGVVGQGIPDWMGGMGSTFVKGAANAGGGPLLSAFLAAAAAASVPSVATAGSAGGIIATMMRNLAAARGWAGTEWNALYALEMAEAGFNMTARNPSSGAYGLAQFINGPSEYYAYGGNPTTAVGQITGMLNYVAQRYGDPLRAEAHELAYHWYDAGGMLPPGLSLAYNGTGAPEPVIPAARARGGAGGSTQTIIIRVDPAVAAVTPDRNLGRQIAQHVTAFIGGGGRLYPAGTTPR